MKQSGIYKIENQLDSKLYIGSAINLRKRWESHQRLLKRQKHPNVFLQRAWNRDGASTFIFTVLELVEDRSLLIEREQAAIEQYRSNQAAYGYNLRRHARSNLGITWQLSDIDRLAAAERMREIGLRRGAWMQTSEGRAFMSNVQSGRKRTAEQRAQMSVYRAAHPNDGCFKPGQQQSEEFRQKVSAALKGKPKSPQARANIAAANQRKALLLTPEGRRAIGDRLRGKPKSVEQRRKISEALRGRPSPLKGRKTIPHTEEWKRLHSEQLKARPRAELRQFTDEQINVIRSLRSAGHTYRDIAERFDTHAGRIFKIVKGIIYSRPLGLAAGGTQAE